MEKHAPSMIYLILSISVFWASTGCDCMNLSCLPEERIPLLEFKNDLHGEGDGILASWKDGSNCCEWDGIVCSNETSHVVQLHLSSFSEFQWPSEKLSPLFKLKQLQYLDLSFNGFNGSIPAGTLNIHQIPM